MDGKGSKEDSSNRAGALLDFISGLRGRDKNREKSSFSTNGKAVSTSCR